MMNGYDSTKSITIKLLMVIHVVFDLNNITISTENAKSLILNFKLKD